MERPVYTKSLAYGILGLKETSSIEEVETARKALVKKLHPDNNIGVSSEILKNNLERLKDVQTAYNAIKSGNFVAQSYTSSTQGRGYTNMNSGSTSHSRARTKTTDLNTQRQSAAVNPKKEYKSSNKYRYTRPERSTNRKNDNPSSYFGTFIHFMNLLFSLVILYTSVFAWTNVESNTQLFIHEIVIAVACFINEEISIFASPAKHFGILWHVFDIFADIAILIRDLIRIKGSVLCAIAVISIAVLWIGSRNIFVAILPAESVIIIGITVYVALMEASQSSNCLATDNPVFHRPLP